jgi:hypothetical protein
MACWNLVYIKIGFKQEQEFKPACRGDTGWEDKPQLQLLPSGENQVLECYSELDLLSISLL